jgi:hypothetical protein
MPARSRMRETTSATAASHHRSMTQNLPLIACSLDGTGQAARLVEWAQFLRLALAREEIPGGVRYAFADSDGGIQARVRALAEAEQDCCSFSGSA